MKKQILLIVTLTLIVGAISWLEINVSHPHASSTPATSVSSPNLTASSTALLIDDSKDPLAKEMTDPSGFINTPDGKPITLADYIGKDVILIDFFTYSCINCQRSTPYLEAWYEKYKDQGLIVIGIHSPEFEFEKEYTNVASAMKQWGVTFPVVLDNDYGTWNAYGNAYWPHKYLIDINGKVVYDHIGEGNYAETEQEIQKVLTDRATILKTGQTIAGGFVNPANAVTTIETESPETYFGWERNTYLGNGPVGQGGVQIFTLPTTLTPNKLYLGGTWDVENQYAETVSKTAEVEYTYKAKDIYIVASAGTPVQVGVYQDGSLIKTITVKDASLYTLVQNNVAGTHTIDLKVQGAGLRGFTFTFG